MNIVELSRDNIVDAMKMGFGFWTETPVYNKYEWDNDSVYTLFKEAIDDNSKCGYLAYDDDVICGMILGFLDKLYFSKDICLYENLLYVIPEKRGSSAAYKLVKAWEKFGKDNGARDIWAGVSSGIKSDKAKSFYNRLGYEDISYGLRKEF